jgi:hypothetical protein
MHLGAGVIDLDPTQEDLSMWAAKTRVTYERLDVDEAKPDEGSLAQVEKRLVDAADDQRIWIADCRPGDKPLTNIRGPAYAQVVVVPVRGGGDQDLSPLGRSYTRVKELRRLGNPDLKMAVFFNAARETSRDRAGEQAVRAFCTATGEIFLGTTRLRDVYPTAFTDGTSLLSSPNPAQEEMLAIMESLAHLLPANLAPAASRAA